MEMVHTADISTLLSHSSIGRGRKRKLGGDVDHFLPIRHANNLDGSRALSPTLDQPTDLCRSFATRLSKMGHFVKLVGRAVIHGPRQSIKAVDLVLASRGCHFGISQRIEMLASDGPMTPVLLMDFPAYRSGNYSSGKIP